MRSRTFREGSVGLFILVGLFVFGGVILWLRGLNPGSKSFKVTIEFANVAGLQEGAPVRYRGVNVGRITSVQPGPNGVEVGIEISPPDLIIPKNAAVEANQAGLIGEAYIEITPRQPLAPQAISAKPLDSNCNDALIVCHKSRLQGEIGISPDALIRYSIRFAELYSDPKFFNKVETVLGNTAEATKEVTQLTREFTSLTRMVKQDLSTFSATAKAAAQAADKIGLTADQVNSLLAANRGSLVSTLENLNQTSAQLRVSVGRLSPMLDRVEQGELIRNLETLSANAAQASANLRDVSVALNNPTNLVVLQETLDSARATFQNAQKITADLDELTGDPAFRNNLRNLVNGLSGLVSSTQQLQQQAQLAQILPPVAEAVNRSGTELSHTDRLENAVSQPVLQSSPPPLDKVGTRN
jgi:phospholipid/cholesterol/gamma-HCH transport system substrate-binding protein